MNDILQGNQIGDISQSTFETNTGTKYNKLLSISAAFWVGMIVLGQWIFSVYILKVYGGSLLGGQPEVWNEILPKGFVPNDTAGNSALISHILFAVVLNVFGPLQLIPGIRRRYPVFHRWNGRVFMTAGLLAALAGTYMNITRGSIGDTMASAIGTYLNAVLIFIFASVAWRYAVQHKLIEHQRWALRAFMVVSATFFIRVGFVFCMAVVSGLGYELEAVMDPLYDAWSFLQYLVPLAILEIYFLTQRSRRSTFRLIGASTVFLAGLVMTAGIAMVAFGYWFPYMAKY